ncbi:MAG: hypothetical protein RI911_324 [Candidatus Parcubacteria bacterium]
MTLVQKLAGFYGVMFLIVAVLGYIPPFVDEQGLLFGLFALDIYDNCLHAASGIWALIAMQSREQSILYFKLFGTVYLLDGIMGLFLGNAFLDFGIFLYGITDYSLIVKFLLNVPHIIIGGFAAVTGFVLSKKYI